MNVQRFQNIGMLASLLVLGMGCSSKHQIARCQWVTMGTIAAIQASTQEDAQRARDLVQPIFTQINNRFSTWQDDTELTAINRAAGTETPTTLSPEMKTVIASALTIAQESDGA